MSEDVQTPAAAPAPGPVEKRGPGGRKVEIFPYGFSMANGPARPVLIFKDKTGQHVLPVWVHPLDATMALHEQATTPIEPHGVAQALMARLGVEVERCDFDELSGHRQYVTVSFSAGFGAVGSGALASSLGKGGRHEMRQRADYAMSFCLAAQARFYSTPDYMARCREIDGNLDLLTGELQGELHASGRQGNDQADGREKGSKNRSYMM